MTRLPKTQSKGLNFENNITTLNDTKTLFHWNEDNEVELPNHIKLLNNLGMMKLRTFPSVLREHKYKQDSQPHEYFYSELLLYRPWSE